MSFFVSFKWRLVFLLPMVTLFIGCNRKHPLFDNLPASKTGIHFTNTLTEKPGLNILYYLYYYNGGGVATGDINQDGLPDIYFSSNRKDGNKLYLNKGNFQFEDITESSGVAGLADWSTGVSMVDINGDGLLDIYVCAVSNQFGLTGRNALYINKGNLNFEEKAKDYGLDFSGLGTQAAFFDFDQDGDLDCYLLNHSKRPHANLIPAANRQRPDTVNGDRLLQNNLSAGQLKFTDITEQAGIYHSSLGYGLGISVADFNNDGWDDLYIGNDFHENDYFYLNNGNGTFSEKGTENFGHFSRFSMGNDAADLDNDGLTDIVTVDMLPPDEKTLKSYGSDENLNSYLTKIIANGYEDQVSHNCIQKNLGSKAGFSDIALTTDAFATDWSWSPLLADYDNDGFTDLFVTSGIVKRPVDLDYVMYVSPLMEQKGMNNTDAYDAEAISKMPDGASHPFFFKGNGAMGLKDISTDWGTEKLKGYYNGAAYADFDLDGDLDLIINCIGTEAVLLKNNTDTSHYLTCSMQGDSLNRFGIGTRIVAFSGDQIFERQLQTARGFMSSSEPMIHFGLGKIDRLDSMYVVWPNHKMEKKYNIAVNQILTLKQQDALQNLDPAQEIFHSLPVSEPEKVPGLNWTHKENAYLDFNRQYLIPHLQSIYGPALAVADVNGDGLDDFFAGGAAGESGILMLQQTNGVFKPGNQLGFEINKDCEEVDALFADFNGDGHKDVYVVSGGGQLDNGDSALADHLYLNDGNGKFSETGSKLPPILTNKSCVTAFDFDRDGDLDLAIGGHVNAGIYGTPQSSYLLINDGKGNFMQADKSIINLDQIGMVSDMAHGDLNGDGYEDLIISGEWMPVKVFENKKGAKFTSYDIPNSTGLWQTLNIADINGDGRKDILAGNWGLNSKLAAGKDGPIKLYIKDFDKNGRVEQILTYSIAGKEYPFYAKDELEKAIPELKKYYLSYGEVAGQTIQYMFYNLFEGYQELKAEKLTSGVFLSTGGINYSWQPFPSMMQWAPVTTFCATGNNQWVAGGNFTGVMPYEGRYDAFPSTFFNYDKNTNAYVANGRINTRNKDVRKIINIKLSNQEGYLIAINNEGILFAKKP